ncbi:Gfo/Idh/MocA family oxidoreductase [Ruminococcus sp. OA3]|uniref:Gfo/Idh/MocA family protein n=1 Tax=Ruminococcus sp. OA3 TaxID=2914164 RepID=UPI001F056A55|nr:Gfo/Idh/MocA family oxidoreductase [Ruminococcus sp. OA3]MCH1981720.1 Gfo/Idh/MocA family oxidoreductase [Ruminococcus sp. OA3]
MERTGVGIIGCGNVSDIYIRNLTTLFPQTDIIACASRHRKSAREAARRYGILACSVDELLQNPEIQLILNLTTPDAHYEITRRALLAGKHVYSEKPICLETEQAKELQLLAEKQGVRLGCAPDTVLGGAVQTSRQLLDSGIIGKPLSAHVFFGWHGPEHEHPNPEFLYQYGAGPVFDYGPYYFTALVTLFGPADSVTAMAGKGFERRTCTCPGPHVNESFEVGTPTHVTGVLKFQSGVLVTVTISFDIWGHGHPFIEIYGTEGTLRAPDPDGFGGEIEVLKAGEENFNKVPVNFAYTENNRGIGLAEMAQSIEQNKPHRAADTVAVHVLEIMHAFLDSSTLKRTVTLTTTCERPAPMERRGL